LPDHFQPPKSFALCSTLRLMPLVIFSIILAAEAQNP
jgi:hypothetical protein